MNFFTNFYNKVFSFFKSSDVEETNNNVKDVARSRLKLVLMQDRTNLTPKILEQMRGELIDLLSKYVELDKELLELNFEQEGDQVALMLSIPVIRARDEKEIEEALKKDALLKGIQLADDEEEAEDSETDEESGDENNVEDTENISTEDENSTEPEDTVQETEPQESCEQNNENHQEEVQVINE